MTKIYFENDDVYKSHCIGPMKTTIQSDMFYINNILTELFIIKNLKILDIKKLIMHQKLSEELIEKYLLTGKLRLQYINDILACQKVSNKFIAKYFDDICTFYNTTCIHNILQRLTSKDVEEIASYYQKIKLLK